MCRKQCGDDWNDRKRFTRIAYQSQKMKFGLAIAEYWIWNETPFPVSLPSWDQIAQAL